MSGTLRLTNPAEARRRVGALWAWLRALSGDDTYERYLRHHLAQHEDSPPLSRRAFCAAELRRKWSGVSRCC